MKGKLKTRTPSPSDHRQILKITSPTGIEVKQNGKQCVMFVCTPKILDVVHENVNFQKVLISEQPAEPQLQYMSIYTQKVCCVGKSESRNVAS